MTGYIALQASLDLAVTFAFGASQIYVRMSAGVAGQPREHNSSQGAVQLTIAAAAQPMTNDLARARFDRRYACQSRKGSLRVKPS